MNNINAMESTNTIRIGLIHSMTGPMAISERPLLDAEMMAINEINLNGGILGHRIEPIVVDGKSDPEHFAYLAKELLETGLKCLFGCWTSASRKAVRPIVEQYNSQLFYPVQYEGLEESKNICYTGSCLNQQILPALEWAIEKFGKRIFLIGSDYVFPRTANSLIRSFVEQMGGEIVHECYIPMGSQNLMKEVEKISLLNPSFVMNTLNGESNFAFYHLCHMAGISSSSTPIIATSISEPDIHHISSSAEGHFACWSYFQSIDNTYNQIFVNNFKGIYGKDRVVSDPMVTAYCQIYLWKMAVEKAGSFDNNAMRQNLDGCSMQSPMGDITVQPNLHLSKPARIGKIISGGQFEIVSEHKEPISPLPWLGTENLISPWKSLVQERLKAFSENVNYNTLLEKEMSRKKMDKLEEEQSMRLVKEVLDKKRIAQMILFQNTVIELACLETEVSFQQKLNRITEMSAHALNVERVSIWFYGNNRDSLSSENIFIKSLNDHVTGMCIVSKEYPNYFTAIENSAAIIANFAIGDPRTIEFAETYFKPQGITSIMDIGIKSEGNLIGIICFEHVSTKRIWGSEEQSFASSIAKIISMQHKLEEKRLAREKTKFSIV